MDKKEYVKVIKVNADELEPSQITNSFLAEFVLAKVMEKLTKEHSLLESVNLARDSIAEISLLLIGTIPMLKEEIISAIGGEYSDEEFSNDMEYVFSKFNDVETILANNPITIDIMRTDEIEETEETEETTIVC